MITTVTLNTSVDRRYILKDICKDEIFRCEDYSYTPGGKGINVSRVLNQLNVKLTCLGFVGGFSGGFIEEQLKLLKIDTNFTKINGETRTCIGIIFEDGSQSEILEKGPEISKKEIDDFIEKYKAALEKSKIITISGSIPKGVSSDIYRHLIELANKMDVKVILDTSGYSLIDGIKASPYLIKPNKDELEAITKIKINSNNDIIRACKDLMNMGAKNIAVSLGKDGMIFFGNEGKFKVRIPKIKVLNTVGSGDSTVAGFALGLLKKSDIEDILKLANACGISNAMEKETGKINVSIVKDLIDSIEVFDIS
ncbi:1-phosphofructokinase [Wukongibacter sp. M2B1]|uniref:1-phosphofructokinase n=1 Tax=Wukongibacter sp. M2B1 TaxID=3088895 RepID=UPI003D79C9E4